MIFLTDPDIEAHLLAQLSRERDQEDREAILNTLEAQNIALIKSKLKGRYDTDAIFKATAAKRHWLMVKILTKLVVFDYVRRNAARKVSEDYVKEWEWAMKILEQIKAGKETPDGLPNLTDEEGNAKKPLIWGNTTNKDHRI